MKRSNTSAFLWLPVLIVAALPCCSGGQPDSYRLENDILGYHLGERKADLLDRARGLVNWERVSERTDSRRTDLYFFSGPIERVDGIERVRIAFIDDYVAEIIVYYTDTSVLKLREMRNYLQNRYGGEATSPDGTIETTYKTYRLKGEGMSITLRRITKRPATELYVQYLHGELHKRMLEPRK